MIGKVPRPGRGFRGLVSYLLRGARRTNQKTDRVAWTTTHNLFTDNPEQAPLLMRMTAAKSVRVVRPVYHFVISWRPEENPTPELMRNVADTTCRDLGLDEHQRLVIAHNDTRHSHVHVVVNRVHPETGIAWATSHDYRRIERSLARQSQELGFDCVPGRHNGRLPGPTPNRVPDGVYQQARREGWPVSVRWSPARMAEWRRLLLPIFATAKDWDGLNAALAQHGLAFVRKGQGAVIRDASGEMKLSDLGTGIRLSALEARLGKWPDTLDQSAAAPVSPETGTRKRRPRERDR